MKKICYKISSLSSSHPERLVILKKAGSRKGKNKTAHKKNSIKITVIPKARHPTFVA